LVIVAPVPVIGPFPGVGFGGALDGRASTDVDVNRSTRSGNAVAR
jgi:hypothetical protein